MLLPSLTLKHLSRLSDSTGIFQHARWAVPDPHHGYTLDDNARALMVALMWHTYSGGHGVALDLAYRYIAFMLGSQHDDGRFRNFMAFDRQWLEDVGSPDSHGRALWALGYTMRCASDQNLRNAAAWMLERAAPHVLAHSQLRTRAFALHGFVDAALADEPYADAEANARNCADALMRAFERHRGPGWQWFENSLTYANATLPHALLAAADLCDDRQRSVDYREAGKRSLDFLIDLYFENGHLDLIGQNGWHARGGMRARFDQQAIDAQCMVEALLYAHRALREPRYKLLARAALEWFYGYNVNRTLMYNSQTGGCYDGLTPAGANPNQGAESTLAHLLARLAWERG